MLVDRCCREISPQCANRRQFLVSAAMLALLASPALSSPGQNDESTPASDEDSIPIGEYDLGRVVRLIRDCDWPDPIESVRQTELGEVLRAQANSPNDISVAHARMLMPLFCLAVLQRSISGELYKKTMMVEQRPSTERIGVLLPTGFLPRSVGKIITSFTSDQREPVSVELPIHLRTTPPYVTIPGDMARSPTLAMEVRLVPRGNQGDQAATMWRLPLLPYSSS